MNGKIFCDTGKLPGLQESITSGFPVLEKTQIKNGYDLTGIFGTQEDIYLDFCHVAHHGNEAVATGIFHYIKPFLQNP